MTDKTSGMYLTAEEVEVAFGALTRLGIVEPPMTDREAKLADQMKLMLGSSADGERRGR